MSKMRSMAVVIRGVDVEHTRQVRSSDIARLCCKDVNEQVICASVDDLMYVEDANNGSGCQRC